MCVSNGAPKKPSYGACHETHQQQPVTQYNGQYWVYPYTTAATTATVWMNFATTSTASSCYINLP
jgi:hypothetical protein